MLKSKLLGFSISKLKSEGPVSSVSLTKSVIHIIYPANDLLQLPFLLGAELSERSHLLQERSSALIDLVGVLVHRGVVCINECHGTRLLF